MFNFKFDKIMKKVQKITLGFLCCFSLIAMLISAPTLTMAQNDDEDKCIEVGYSNYYHNYACCTWPEGIYCGTMQCSC